MTMRRTDTLATYQRDDCNLSLNVDIIQMLFTIF